MPFCVGAVASRPSSVDPVTVDRLTVQRNARRKLDAHPVVRRGVATGRLPLEERETPDGNASITVDGAPKNT